MKCFKLVLSYRKLNATHSLIACITMYMPPYMAIVSRLAFSSQVKHLQMATNHTKLCSHTPHNHNNKFSRKFPRLCSESHSFRTYVCIRLYCFIAISSNNLVKNTIPMCLRVCVCASCPLKLLHSILSLSSSSCCMIMWISKCRLDCCRPENMLFG